MLQINYHLAKKALVMMPAIHLVHCLVGFSAAGLISNHSQSFPTFAKKLACFTSSRSRHFKSISLPTNIFWCLRLKIKMCEGEVKKEKNGNKSLRIRELSTVSILIDLNLKSSPVSGRSGVYE